MCACYWETSTLAPPNSQQKKKTLCSPPASSIIKKNVLRALSAASLKPAHFPKCGKNLKKVTKNHMQQIPYTFPKH
jgi:hypothetical protein